MQNGWIIERLGEEARGCQAECLSSDGQENPAEFGDPTTISLQGELILDL